MIKCPSCSKGYLCQNYGQPIECDQCSKVFVKAGNRIIPAVSELVVADNLKTVDVVGMPGRKIKYYRIVTPARRG